MKHFIFCLLMILETSAWAELVDIPFIKDDPETNLTFTPETFESVAKILAAGRLGPHLECRIRTELRHELRKYSDRSEWVDFIEITFSTNAGYARGDEMKVKFPRSSSYGRKMTANKWSGEGEDFKISAGDYYDHWIRFIHDGKGHIVLLMMGNNLKTYPCLVQDL